MPFEPRRPFAQRTTPFVLWANYEADFSDFESGMTLSANYLGPLLVQAAGLPMTGMQKFLWQMQEEYPVVSNVGLMAAGRNFHPAGYHLFSAHRPELFHAGI